MRVALEIAAVVGLVAAVGCGTPQRTRRGSSTVTILPDEFVMRDVRRDASRHLRCQAPMIRVRVGPWAGSEGNVAAIGCGTWINYFLRCSTNHLCSFTIN